ncbi:snRNA-activating protein of 50kDa MW C terminal-domain-containing protein [Phascolomyces articulosus]|uniref:snRNA-activating protein of 50kDa MW C terminal-domain-containing protein n=1 Tax=Phascolomyces articulosus TaxID=60185 RepID=A0AAD5K553_9FUNG|nr:snRNA-activating protein of 50kDa MW C terminal-domain-containing protein [Phascolomyces articulosus]
MSKINVGEFKRSHIELIKQQKELEKNTLDIEVLKSNVDLALLETHPCLQSASDFFNNPTLFELLKRHKETEVNSWLRRRIRGEQDQIVKKKPQAKDVKPNRTLSEEDERLLQEMEKHPHLGQDNYINPIVPKRRKFVAQHNAPGALQELYAGYQKKARVSNSQPSTTPGSPSTISTASAYFTPFDPATPSTIHSRSQQQQSSERLTESLVARLEQQQQRQALNTGSSSSSPSSTTADAERANRLTQLMHPELALPGLQGETVIEEDEEEDENQYHSVNESDQASMMAVNPPDLNNPAIPKTHLTRMYMEMEEQIKTSPLHSLSPAHVIDLIPRQRTPLNYAHFNREKPKKLSESGPEILKPAKTKRGKKRKNRNDDPEEDQDKQVIEENEDTDEEMNLQDSKDREPDLQDEVILRIAVYHPQNPNRRVREFDVLGSQKLTELRDAIYCMKDFAAYRDRKNREEDGTVLNTITKKMSASYIFIEDVFYVDTRAEAAGLGTEPDYSEGIRRWVMEKERYKQENLNEYTREPMEDVAFEDLQIQLNHPYQFLHQENCQHVIMVRDIRMQSSNDPKKRSEYPYTTYNWQYTRYKCSMCTIYPAEFMTINDVMSGSSPCFFCRKCYGPFHFDKDGNQMFPYAVSDYLGA